MGICPNAVGVALHTVKHGVMVVRSPWYTFTSRQRSRCKFVRRVRGLPTGRENRGNKCWLHGCRAPELAAGDPVVVLEELLKRALQTVYGVCADLTPEEYAKILSDWEFGRAQISRMIMMKFVFWVALPHKLCGMGHWDSDIARHVAREILRELDGLPRDASGHHRLTWKFLNPGELHDQMRAFAEGQPFSELPALQNEIATLFFIRVVEREQEARHAEIHKAIAARGAGGAYISNVLRLPQSKDCIRRVAVNYTLFTDKLEITRHARKAIVHLGFRMHPEIKDK